MEVATIVFMYITSLVLEYLIIENVCLLVSFLEFPLNPTLCF